MRRRAEGGWALVSVLWGLMIISLIAAVMLSSARVSYRQATYGVEQAQRQALADAATARAVLGLLDTRLDHRWRVDGVPQIWDFDGQRMVVAVEDEGGKIDLNASGDPAIRQLVNAVAPKASGLADNILDWRQQTGDLHRLQGATGADYAAAARDYHPRGGPFQSVDELKLVLGMTPAIFESLVPAVTVYSGRAKVNLATAPEAVLMAAAGQDAEAAAATVAARRGIVSVGESQRQPIENGVVQAGIPIDGWAFSIRVIQSGDKAAHDRVIRIIGKEGVLFYQATTVPGL